MGMIYDGDYCVRLIALPYAIHAQTSVDCNGFFNIYINALLPYTMQLAAFWHEIRHIQRGDFYNYDGIKKIEAYQ